MSTELTRRSSLLLDVLSQSVCSSGRLSKSVGDSRLADCLVKWRCIKHSIALIGGRTH